MITDTHAPGVKADSGKATYRLLVEDMPFALDYFLKSINCPLPVYAPTLKSLLSFLMQSMGARPTLKELAVSTLQYFVFECTSCETKEVDALKADALHAMADVAGYGARKYTPCGRKNVPDGLARYTEAMYRHCFALLGGEERDQESGYPHRSHILWNCLAILQFGHDADSLDKTCIY